MCRLLFQTQNPTVIRQQNAAPPCKKRFTICQHPRPNQRISNMTDLKTRLHDILPKGASIGCDWFVESAQNATLKATDGREFIDLPAASAW